MSPSVSNQSQRSHPSFNRKSFKWSNVMKGLVLFAVIALVVAAALAKLFPYEPRNPLSGREWPPGSPWPLPKVMNTSETVFTFDPNNGFAIDFTLPDLELCDPLNFALTKYNKAFLFPTIEGVTAFPDLELPVIPSLQVTITGDSTGNTHCRNYPQLSKSSDYEHYTLSIGEDGDALILAETVWGALKGIETFSQLIFSNEKYEEGEGPLHFYINATQIEDQPRFPHRGFMMDTARHYQPEKRFYEIMDGMMYNKLNVLHWHVTDDQSFPFVSTRFPDLSNQGAYTRRHIYSQEMIARVIEAGRLRGIRVILEFDTPGHTQSWGNAYPELLTPCYGKPNEPGTPSYPDHAARENINPMINFTYQFMEELFSEIVSNVTVDQYIHLGMDEVYPECWKSSPEIAAFMEAHGLTNISQVQEYYTERHIAMVKRLGAKPICWQDPLDFGVKLDPDVVIQVWKDWGPDWMTHFQNVLDLGYKALLSGPWYINYISYGETWAQYYLADPVLSLPNITTPQLDQILGGEACLWGEFVDKTNILPRLFPFISAVAERLWSHDIPITDSAVVDARNRLDIHRCRMLQRGLPAQPILNGFCGAWEVFE